MASFRLMESTITNLKTATKSHDTNSFPGSEIAFFSFDDMCERCLILCSRLKATLLQDEILETSKINNLRKSLIAQFPESHQSTISRLFVYDDVKLSTSLHSTERRSTVETVSTADYFMCMSVLHFASAQIISYFRWPRHQFRHNSHVPTPCPGGDDPGWDRHRQHGSRRPSVQHGAARSRGHNPQDQP